ncbi:MAG: outer membrane beta-barrel protein [Saprospiraceae bacterium]|nr:outer membrane beta-barrel protein [Saprospiraceae bacterium]
MIHSFFKPIIRFVLPFLFIHFSMAQQMGVGFMLGGANYAGDLTENWKSSFSQTKPTVGLLYNLQLNPIVDFKLQYWLLSLQADDALSTQDWKKQRNFNFKSTIHNIDVGVDLHLWSMIQSQYLLNPYLSLGLSFFKFNPKTKFEGNWVNLSELGTEGQGMPGYAQKYSLFSHAMTFGVGLEYPLSHRISIGLELKWRKTQTDYLDDLSGKYVSYDDLLFWNGRTAAELGNPQNITANTQRGNSKDNDWFQTFSIHFVYHWTQQISLLNPVDTPKRTRKLRCPKF